MPTSFRTFLLAAAALASPLAAQTPPASPAAATARPATPFIPAGFTPPTRIEGPGFVLVPLGPEVVKLDYDAYMASIDHLQKTFSRSTNWPRQGITDAEAMKDMEGEQARFRARKSFAYAVLTPDGRRERGSVYVSPSPVPGHDAIVRLWVTKADYDAGFDAALYQWVRGWVAKDWPFRTVAYPGRSIDWATWDAAVAARKAAAGKGTP
ncbi:twin-arginine translocation pathway signal protein [Sphingomonas sp.]|uniref:twin-arginine translocation pathway signal protein n=1 Tax=Sphingomonas sp. TaxID=28214 RepID=UPI003B3AF51F